MNTKIFKVQEYKTFKWPNNTQYKIKYLGAFNKQNTTKRWKNKSFPILYTSSMYQNRIQR